MLRPVITPDAAAFPDMFGAYLHIPFCASKCDYCAFATWTDRHHLTSDREHRVIADQLAGGQAGAVDDHICFQVVKHINSGGGNGDAPLDEAVC